MDPTPGSSHAPAIQDALGHVAHRRPDAYGSYPCRAAHGLDCADSGDEARALELDLFPGFRRRGWM